MAKYTAPEDIQIAALQKKARTVINLMVSGSGIPWEDRGSVGYFSAFFKTAFAAMFNPVSLLRKIRRPETTADARAFSFWCATIWFLAVISQSTFAYYVYYHGGGVLFGAQYIVNTLFEALAAAAAAVLMPKVVGWMYHRLTAYEMDSKAPPLLVYNCVVYIMGPSLLALIPGGLNPWIQYGPILAAAWMSILLFIVGFAYLRVQIGSALIGAILTTLGSLAIVVAIWFALWLVWVYLLGYDSLLPPPPPPPPFAR